MQQIQQAIIAIILDKFPGCNIMPSYEPETGLHIFNLNISNPNTTIFSIVMPAGFLMTQIHVKQGRQIFFEMMIHDQVFRELYQPIITKSAEQCYA